MLINRSSKYNAQGEFWHEGRKVDIRRVWAGISFHGNPKFIVTMGEENFYNQINYYILAEGCTQPEHGESLTDIFNLALRLEAEYKIKRFFGRLDTNVQETLSISNKLYYNSGLKNLVVMDVPRIGEWIDEQIALVRMLTRKEDKRLFFFQESMVTGELSEMPKKDIKAEDFPRATALANVVAGMMKFGHESVSSTDLLPPIEPVF